MKRQIDDKQSEELKKMMNRKEAAMGLEVTAVGLSEEMKMLARAIRKIQWYRRKTGCPSLSSRLPAFG